MVATHFQSAYSFQAPKIPFVASRPLAHPPDKCVKFIWAEHRWRRQFISTPIAMSAIKWYLLGDWQMTHHTSIHPTIFRHYSFDLHSVAVFRPFFCLAVVRRLCAMCPHCTHIFLPLSIFSYSSIQFSLFACLNEFIIIFPSTLTISTFLYVTYRMAEQQQHGRGDSGNMYENDDDDDDDDGVVSGTLNIHHKFISQCSTLFYRHK